MAIKIFRSDQMGAPLIAGTNGSLVAALDAILVNGYGQVGVASIVRSSSVATVTTDSPHGFATGDVALIAGAGQVQYNGEHVVTVIDSTSYTIAVAGEPATPATGSITSRRAPAGFSKPFAAANKAVYRSNDPSGLRHFYRVIDTGEGSSGAREAMLHGFTSMSDMDTGTDQFPGPGQYPHGFAWVKSTEINAVGRHWLLVTDGKTVYHFSYQATTLQSGQLENPSSYSCSVAFGDLVPFRAGDIYASFCTGGSAQNNGNSGSQYYGLFNQSRLIGAFAPSSGVGLIGMPRDFTFAPTPKTGQVLASGLGSALGYEAYTQYPHIVDNGFYMTPALVVQSQANCIRARLPGFFEPLHGACLPNTAVIDGVQGYPGRKFMMMHCRHAGYNCACMIDITGPWDS